jgi:hypothetical protein
MLNAFFATKAGHELFFLIEIGWQGWELKMLTHMRIALAVNGTDINILDTFQRI